MTTDALHDPAIVHGTKIGRFVVIAELGSGGMGVVYAAHDPELDRQVALKVMRGAAEDDEDRLRMLREGRAMARVTHPNVITVYEVGTEGGSVFLAQELLDDGTLDQWLATPRALPAILDKFVAAGRGLAAAHAAGLVHRDFKPDNVLLGKDGRVRVADFGLARAVGALPEVLAATTRGGSPHGGGDETRSPMSRLTRTGAVMGTPMFMAPEQHRGEHADERADQFGFCVALYRALYRTWPFAGKSAVALADAVLDGRLEPPPKRTTVPARVHQIVVRGLRTDPAERHPSMDALLAELTHVPRRRPGRLALLGAGLAVVAGTAAGGDAVLRARTPAPAPAEVTPPPPMPPTERPAPTTKPEITWLTAAIDRGQLDDALDKYAMDATIKLKDGDRVQAAIAQAAGAFTLVLRGELTAAEARLAQATQNAGEDPMARAYADMAAAAFAAARGDLTTALERSTACARAFTTLAPELAAMCHQLHGDTAADRGDPAGARRAYDAGLSLATHHAVERTSALQLALAQLDLDEQRRDQAATAATRLQEDCRERGAVGCELHARILLARILLGKGDSADALELLASARPATIQTFRIRLAHQLALGEVHGYMNEAGDDGITGLERIEAARAEAAAHEVWGLVLEAKLARVRVLLAHELEGAHAEYEALRTEAAARGFGRITRLAEIHLTELQPPP